MKPSSTRVLASLALLVSSSLAMAEEAWVKESNVHATAVLEAQAKFNPEGFSALGITSADTEIADLQPDLYERVQADTRRLQSVVTEAKRTTENPRVTQDLDIMLKSLGDQLHTNELNQKYLLPYFNVSQSLFNGFQQLLDPRNDHARYPAALERLKKYTGQAKGTKPITELARERTEERFDEPGLIGPYRVQLEKDLENVARYREGLTQVFTESGIKGWEKDLELLNTQLDAYAEWLRQEMTPRAREDARLPDELYADNLKNFGVDADPHELIRIAQLGFADLQRQMNNVARQIAIKHGYPSTDYRAVLKELNKDQLPEDEVLPYYLARLEDIEKIIRDNNLVSLPDRDARIRLATEAESAAVPASFMNPPQLIGNTGQAGEFVLVTRNPTDESGEPMTDFGSKASTWTLIAHEARPGHEMQFSALVENGVSLARAVYAFNSANVEGWGLYAEAIMLEYFSPEAQLFSLKARLMRAARAFIDPMLNLGLIEREEALDFLKDDVGLSHPMALQEVDRYTYRAPGQATSYYYGYINLMALRTEVELRMRDRFNQREYHDFLLEQGLLPPDILRQAVMEGYVGRPD